MRLENKIRTRIRAHAACFGQLSFWIDSTLQAGPGTYCCRYIQVPSPAMITRHLEISAITLLVSFASVTLPCLSSDND